MKTLKLTMAVMGLIAAAVMLTSNAIAQPPKTWTTDTDWRSPEVARENLVIEGTGQAASLVIGNWFSGFSYRKKITITNFTTSALTDYPITVEAVWNDHMQTDFDDLRFTKDDCKTLIPYYLASINTSVTPPVATALVKVPNIIASGDTTIYMYYGSPTATSGSGAMSDIFLFADDFEDGTLTKWTKGGNKPENWDVATVGTTKMARYYFSDYPWPLNYLYAAITLPEGYILEADVMIKDSGFANIQLACDTTDPSSNGYKCGWDKRWFDATSSYEWCKYIRSGTSDLDIIKGAANEQVKDTLYHFQVKRDRSNGKIEATIAGDNLSATNSSYTTGGIALCVSRSYGTAGYGYICFDNVKVQKYISLEPTVILGAEE